jgi:CheY-like chemotaxis protein
MICGFVHKALSAGGLRDAEVLCRFLIEQGGAERIRDMSNRPLSILAIDDEADILEAVRIGVRSCGWTLAAAVTPEDGLIMARQLLPDVILCDAAMPKLSGPQVIQMLKEDPATAHIPVILMTGIAESHLFDHVPWTNFLAKPFGARELRDAIYSASLRRSPSTIE